MADQDAVRALLDPLVLAGERDPKAPLAKFVRQVGADVFVEPAQQVRAAIDQRHIHA